MARAEHGRAHPRGSTRFPLAARAVKTALDAARSAAGDGQLDATVEEQVALDGAPAAWSTTSSPRSARWPDHAALHGTPDFDNKTDPVDELVYIILSRKTREDAYQSAYAALRRRFHRWDRSARRNACGGGVAALVQRGLGEKKTTSLFGALHALTERFGSCTMEPARDWTDEKLEEFLGLPPELSRKSAYCIMMYAFGWQVLPVDTHVGRVLSRLDLYRSGRSRSRARIATSSFRHLFVDFVARTSATRFT